MSWLFSRALVEESLGASFLASALFAPLSVMLTAHAFSRRGKTIRDFKAGDTLFLRETRHTGQQMRMRSLSLEYTGRTVTKTVSHVLSGYGLSDHWVCLSFASQQREPQEAAEQWRLINPIGQVSAEESTCIRAWARINGYKMTVEGLLGYEQMGWRVVQPRNLPNSTRHEEPKVGAGIPSAPQEASKVEPVAEANPSTKVDDDFRPGNFPEGAGMWRDK